MPRYLGNTKIDKFIAKIEGGAASLEGNLTVITPPTKLVYDVGDSFDPRGMKVIATIGGLEVPVGSYTISPDPLVAGTTEVVLTYELDGKTATGSQNITVNSWKSVLQQNTWEQIADCAAKGKAQEWWSIGDSKPLLLGTAYYTATIVDFDHYSLAISDEKYNTNYNKGTNKAGITFMLTELSDSKILWAPAQNRAISYSQSNCKTEIEKSLALGPNEWAENLRTVEVFSHKTDASEDVATFEQAALKIYAPGSRETSGVGPAWPTNKQKKFAYFANGDTTLLHLHQRNSTEYSGYWSRDGFRGDTSYLAIYISHNSGNYAGGADYLSNGTRYPYTFVFNL